MQCLDSLKLYPGAFSSLVRYVYAGENTAVTFRCGPKQPSRDHLCVVQIKLWSGSIAARTWFDPESAQTQEVKQNVLCVSGCGRRFSVDVSFQLSREVQNTACRNGDV